ncbi:MAG: hypothetical protein ACOYN0_19530, partial [Phycisphaerales bacterium]
PAGPELSNATVVVVSTWPLNSDYFGMPWLQQQPYHFYVLTRGLTVEYPDNNPSQNSGTGPDAMHLYFIVSNYYSLPAYMIFVNDNPSPVRCGAVGCGAVHSHAVHSHAVHSHAVHSPA